MTYWGSRPPAPPRLRSRLWLQNSHVPQQDFSEVLRKELRRTRKPTEKLRTLEVLRQALQLSKTEVTRNVSRGRRRPAATPYCSRVPLRKVTLERHPGQVTINTRQKERLRVLWLQKKKGNR